MSYLRVYGNKFLFNFKNEIGLQISSTLLFAFVSLVRIIWYLPFPVANDELAYLESGVNLFNNNNNYFGLDISYSPIYILTIFLFKTISGSGIFAYYANYIFYLSLIYLGLIRILRIANYNYFYIFTIVFFIILGDGLIFNERHVTLPVISVLIHLIAYTLKFKNYDIKLLPVYFLLGIIIPLFRIEAIIITVTLLFLMIFITLKHKLFKSPKILYTICYIFYIIFIYFSISKNDSRDLIAFKQHFALYYFSETNSNLSPWLNYDKAFEPIFGNSKSVMEAYKTNTFWFINFFKHKVLILNIATRDWLSNILIPKYLFGFFPLAMRIIISIMLMAVIFLYLVIRFFKAITNELYIIILLLSTVFLGIFSCLWVYPNYHYLPYFFPLIFISTVYFFKTMKQKYLNLKLRQQLVKLRSILMILPFLLFFVFLLNNKVNRNEYLKVITLFNRMLPQSHDVFLYDASLGITSPLYKIKNFKQSQCAFFDSLPFENSITSFYYILQAGDSTNLHVIRSNYRIQKVKNLFDKYELREVDIYLAIKQ